MSKTNQTIMNFMNEDWERIIVKKWQQISPVTKKSFLWIFCVVNLVFLWHTVTFFFGNHDWNQIKYGLSLGWSMFDGRWGAGAIQQITGGDILPVWNNLFCFTGFTFAVILLAKYWQLPKKVSAYVTFGLFIILMPYTLPWLQYIRSETHFWNVFLIVSALVLSADNKWYKNIVAFLILYFCFGCYAGMLPTVIVVFLGRCILDVWFDNKTLKQLIKERCKTFAVIVGSFIAFGATFVLIKKYGHVIDFMTMEEVGIKDLFDNFINVGHKISDTFFHTIPSIPAGLKILFGLAVPMVVFLMRKYKLQKLLLLSFLFVCLILSTQITDLLSKADYSNVLRIDFFAMPYFYALYWTILLKTGKIWKNLALFFMIVAILYCGLQDVRDQKIKYFDKQLEMKIFDDITARIRANHAFDRDKQYNLLMIGEASDGNRPSSFDIYNSVVTWQNSWITFVPAWNAEEYFNFYAKKPFIRISYSPLNNILTDEDLLKMDRDYILNRAKPFPDFNSTHVDENYIYIVFTQKELDELRIRLNNLIQKEKMNDNKTLE